jgi:hypothetical protein
MNELLKIGLIGGAAWLAWQYLFPSTATAATPTTPAASTPPAATAAAATTTAAAATTAATPSAAQIVLNILNATNPQTVLAAAQKDPAFTNPGLNVWQWNWYANTVTGLTLGDPVSNMAQIMSFQNYWAALMAMAQSNATQGLSGFGNYVRSR